MPETLVPQRPTAAREPRRRILNARTICKPQEPVSGLTDYFDDETPGLSLRVTPNGVRTWSLFYRDQARRLKRLTLGHFPAVTLADARELAREAQLKVAKGGDPVSEKLAAREVLTFDELASQYIEIHAKPNNKSWTEDQRQLDTMLLPKWKNRPAADITAENVIEVLNQKVKAGSPIAANRLRALVSRGSTRSVSSSGWSRRPRIP